MKHTSAVILILVLFVLIIAGCGPAAFEPPPEPTVHPGKTVVTSRCVGCHEMNRVENASFDHEGWQLTVDRMVLVGAQLNDEQVSLVVDYLAQTYPKQ